MAGHGTSCQRRQWIRVLWSHDHHDPKQTAALGGARPSPTSWGSRAAGNHVPSGPCAAQSLRRDANPTAQPRTPDLTPTHVPPTAGSQIALGTRTK